MAEASTPKAGHNSLAEKGKAFVERVETLNKDLATEQSNYMTACKGIRGDIKVVLSEAKDEGIPAKVIRAAVKARTLERKAREARDALDMADQDTLDNIRHALGDFADTDLGQAAIDKAA